MIATVAIGLVLLGFALSIDVPAATRGFRGDEATYYCLTYSLARDFDLEYRREDLVRVWEEYSGPEGVFLKKGKQGRLYYGKAFIYPLVAAPFVRALGTNGFLVLHALLLALDFAAAYTLLVARGTRRGLAAAYAGVFFGASVVPLYFTWLMPEVFNLSLVMYAAFVWAYKEAVPSSNAGGGRIDRWLRSSWSDVAAAVLVGIATFSKPSHAAVMLPIFGLLALRRRWGRVAQVAVVFALAAGGLFAVNRASSGEANYQGGDRKTFYGPPPPQSTYVGPHGFPFDTPESTFETTGQGKATEEIPVDVLITSDMLRVFRHNVWYFVAGRHAGLVPYFFPGIVSAVLFLFAPGTRRTWQWLTLAALVAAAVGLLLYLPYTYSGGGGPIGNRYFLSFYPLFLLLTPPLRRAGSAIVALAIGTLFTGKILFTPFTSSRNPGEAAKAGPLRLLPIELTTVNDLPVAAYANRSRLPLGGEPSLRGYFPDDNAFDLEGDRFWVRGGTRAEIILRSGIRTLPDGRLTPLRVTRLDVEVSNGGSANRITLAAGRGREVLDLGPFETRRLSLALPYGVPYRPRSFPTNYIYVLTVTTTAGFVPRAQDPSSTDARFLGAMIKLTPSYTDAQ